MWTTRIHEPHHAFPCTHLVADDHSPRALRHPASLRRTVRHSDGRDRGVAGTHHDADRENRRRSSVVVTVLNEATTLDELYERTTATLEGLGRPFELIVVDDGSTDGTFAALERLHAADPRVRAVRFKRSFGQHPAMHAGLVRARGDIVVTMDGDLQNQPEDIPRLVEAIEAGYDVASGRRAARRDSWGRTLPSRLINGMLRRFTGVAISDFGCAFNAYRRTAVEPMLGSIGGRSSRRRSSSPAVRPSSRSTSATPPRRGACRYSPLRLTRLALHVLAGFWPQPIQWVGVALGVALHARGRRCSASTGSVLDRPGRLPGPLFGGTAIVFVLGVQGFILALVGEYLGRIQREVERRPLYTIDRELVCARSACSSPAAPASSPRT